MVWSEKPGRLNFHAGIVRANKRQVNVPFGNKPLITSQAILRNLPALIGV